MDREKGRRVKQTKLERQRNLVYFLILATLVLNVFDSATTGYFVLRYGLSVEANPIAYAMIANMGIVGFHLLKLVGVTFMLLFIWFVVEAIQTPRLMLLTLIMILAVFGILAFAVINNYSQIGSLI